jgi:dihydroorotase-like cyclic amidohydrolase
MAMLDLIIQGGEVVTPQGVMRCDVGIAGETIAAVAAPGTLSADNAQRVVDAGGKIVMPGGIDPHIHCQWGPMTLPDGSMVYTDGPDVVSRAALFGGTTTLLDFAIWDGQEALQKTVERRDRDWVGQCYCDFSYHLMLLGKLPHTLMDEVGELIGAGYPSVKIFTTDITPSKPVRLVDYGDLWELFKVLAKRGGLGLIHGEDNDIVMHMYEKLFREGRTGFEWMAEVHNALSEDLSFRRVLKLAESVPGTALYFVHVSAGTGVNALAEARAKGLPMYGETLHQYICFTSDDYQRPHGQIYHTYPSLKSAADQKTLWDGTTTGTISTVATDELCCTLKVKTSGNKIDDTVGGNAGVEPRLGVMYTEMVVKRGYSLSRYADMVSSNAAKIMGLYPRKGAIAPGSDADLAILTRCERRQLRKEDLHETDYSPWEGHDIHAWPTMTILRGKVMVENGALLGSLRDGRYLKRRIPADILAGPAL